MDNVSSFFETVGRQKFRRALGVKESALSRAKAQNRMPPGWYLAAREFCQREGISVPEHLFGWHVECADDREAS